MAVLGQCALCRKPANHTCGICGRMVCEDHYHSRERVCDQCFHGKISERENRPWLKR